jgi:hypothetical protein
MGNYGEVLTYWYLRLNGFFPLANFVLHRVTENAKASDCDILAVRFPNVCEEVGGQEKDWDEPFLLKVGRDKKRTLCLIAEVKTGDVSWANLHEKFSKERLRYAIRRIGVLYPAQADALAAELYPLAILSNKTFSIAKVAFIAEEPTGAAVASFFVHRLSDVEEFIAKRMKAYAGDKEPDRMFFPDPLIQHFAAKAGVELVNGQGDS